MSDLKSRVGIISDYLLFKGLLEAHSKFIRSLAGTDQKILSEGGSVLATFFYIYIYIYFLFNVSEYDQEISQSHTAGQPTAP